MVNPKKEMSNKRIYATKMCAIAFGLVAIIGHSQYAVAGTATCKVFPLPSSDDDDEVTGSGPYSWSTSCDAGDSSCSNKSSKNLWGGQLYLNDNVDVVNVTVASGGDSYTRGKIELYENFHNGGKKLATYTTPSALSITLLSDVASKVSSIVCSVESSG